MGQVNLKAGTRRRGMLAATLGAALMLGLFQSGSAAATAAAVESRRQGEVEAARLLTLLSLPPGAVYSATQPAGSNPRLAGPVSSPGALALIDTPAWWLAPGSPDSVLAWLESHPPEGSTLNMRSSSLVHGAVESQSVTFTLAPVPGAFEWRGLLVTVAPEPGGRTGVRADAQVVRTVPRPAGDRIPLRSRVLEVRYSGGSARPGGFTVDHPPQVRRIVKAINALQIVQPSGPVYGCGPFFDNPRLVTLTFRGRAGGRALAVTRQNVPGGHCDGGMSLTVDGKRRTPLAGGEAVVRALRPLRPD